MGAPEGCPLIRAAIESGNPKVYATVTRLHPPEKCPSARRQAAGDTEGTWHHRGPCGSCPGPCRVCGSSDCHVWVPDDPTSSAPQIHICANGCDGQPPRLDDGR